MFPQAPGERFLKSANQGWPIAGCGLAEMAHGWVPGIILALAQITPIATMGKYRPYRMAECTGEMGERRIDEDHQIEPGDGIGGMGEIREAGAQILDIGVAGNIRRRRPDLKALAGDIAARQERRKMFNRARAPPIYLVGGIARPGETNLEACPRRSAQLPRIFALRNIGGGRRHSVRVHVQDVRQAGKRRMLSKFRHGAIQRNSLADTRHAGQQTTQRLLTGGQ